jgi:F-type H+-transporting ATPase subunit delta
MPNPRLASRYAKSLLDLAIEKGQLDTAYADMKYLQAVCAASSEFVSLLRSPIIKADQKNSIVAAVTTGKVSELTAAFNNLLVRKGRESDLPEIATAFVEQYNALKDIHKVTLTTAVEVSAEMQQAIAQKVKAANSFASVELESKVDPSLRLGPSLFGHAPGFGFKAHWRAEASVGVMCSVSGTLWSWCVLIRRW